LRILFFWQARKVEERIQDEMRKELALEERQEAIRQVPPLLVHDRVGPGE
jgi:hypothetical protein